MKVKITLYRVLTVLLLVRNCFSKLLIDNVNEQSSLKSFAVVIDYRVVARAKIHRKVAERKRTVAMVRQITNAYARLINGRTLKDVDRYCVKRSLSSNINNFMNAGA